MKSSVSGGRSWPAGLKAWRRRRDVAAEIKRGHRWTAKNNLQKKTQHSYRLGLNKFRLEQTEKCSQPSGEWGFGTAAQDGSQAPGGRGSTRKRCERRWVLGGVPAAPHPSLTRGQKPNNVWYKPCSTRSHWWGSFPREYRCRQQGCGSGDRGAGALCLLHAALAPVVDFLWCMLVQRHRHPCKVLQRFHESIQMQTRSRVWPRGVCGSFVARRAGAWLSAAACGSRDVGCHQWVQGRAVMQEVSRFPALLSSFLCPAVLLQGWQGACSGGRNWKECLQVAEIVLGVGFYVEAWWKALAGGRGVPQAEVRLHLRRGWCMEMARKLHHGTVGRAAKQSHMLRRCDSWPRLNGLCPNMTAWCSLGLAGELGCKKVPSVFQVIVIVRKKYRVSTKSPSCYVQIFMETLPKTRRFFHFFCLTHAEHSHKWAIKVKIKNAS